MSRPFAVVFLAVFLLPNCRSLASPYYQITRMDSPGMTFVGASLNNSGQVAGTVTYQTGVYGTTTQVFSPAVSDPTQGGKVTLLGVTSPSGTNLGKFDWEGNATGLNNAGQVVGYSFSDNKSYVYDTASESIKDVPMWVSAISDSGQILGTNTVYETDGTSNRHPFIYQNGSLADLGQPSGTRLTPIAVNASGQILATGFADSVLASGSSVPKSTHISYLYSQGKWTTLGEFSASLMNAKGDVAGLQYSSSSINSISGAVFLPRGGTLTSMGALPGDNYSIPIGMNARGEIVGLSCRTDGSYLERGFLYNNGTMTNLNDLIDPASGWTIKAALQINDKGQILAFADRKDEQSRLLLLTPSDLDAPPDAVMPELPVPEPASFLVFSGLCAACVWQVRSRRSKT